MLVNFLIKAPSKNVESLSKQMDTCNKLKHQHHAAFLYRLKRFAATKAGLTSAFIAGAAVQAGKSDTSLVRKYSWLFKLIA
jgi:hypothetical protein